MPVMPEGRVRATGPHYQAYGNPRDHAPQEVTNGWSLKIGGQSSGMCSTKMEPNLPQLDQKKFRWGTIKSKAACGGGGPPPRFGRLVSVGPIVGDRGLKNLALDLAIDTDTIEAIEVIAVERSGKKNGLTRRIFPEPFHS
jgi:hypothetical protein